MRVSRLLSVVLVLVLNVGLAAAQPSDSGPFATSSSDWEGYSEFVRLAQRRLGTRRVILSSRLNYSGLRPGDAVLMVRPLQSLDDRSLGAFLADGGRVALLDDYGEGGSLLRKFDILRIAPPADPAQTLRDNADLPIAVPSVQHVAGNERGRHPMAEHVERVATNHPVALRHPDLTPVLEIRSSSGESLPIAVTGVIAQHGRLYAQGDPSIFINLMMSYPGNRNLADGLIQYLVARRADGDLTPATWSPDDSSSEQGTSSGRLYIVTNRFEQIGSYGEEDSFWDDFREKLNELMKTASEVRNEGLPDHFALILAAGLSFWLFTSQVRGHLRAPRLLGPTFAERPRFAPLGGVNGRALLLGAKKTNPVLALLELDAALRESISSRLKLSPRGGKEDLARCLSTSALDEKDSLALATLLAELREFGQSLSDGKPRRASDRELKRLHQESMRLLSEIETVGNSK